MKLLLVLLLPLLIFAAEPEPAQEKSDQTDGTVQKTKPFYTPDEVSQASVALRQELSEINASLTPSKEIAEMEATLPAYVEAVGTMRAGVDTGSLENASIKQLTRTLENAKVYADELEKYDQTLQERLDTHNELIRRLKTLEALWVATLQNATAENAPEAIIERINTSLVEIATMRELAKRSYDKVLTYTDMTVAEAQKVRALMKTIEDVRSQLETHLFVKDSEPLLDAMAEYTYDLPAFVRTALGTLNDIRKTSILFYKNNIDRFYIHALLTFGVLGLMLYLFIRERRGALFVTYDDKVRSSLLFVRSPVAATVILSVMMVAAIYPERPTAVTYTNSLIALTALLLIIYRMTDRRLFYYALLLGILFAVGGLLNQIIGFELDIRLLWFMITVIMLLALYNFFRPGGDLKRYTLGKWLRFIARLGPVALLILGVSLFANLLGYYHLAYKLVRATLVSLTIFMAFSVVGMVFGGLITMFVRRRSLASKHLLESYALQIENNLKFIVNTFLVLYWFYLVFRQFEITRYLKERYDAFMAQAWQIGDVTFSVGALVDFLIVLAVTSFLTRFVRIVLDLEVFGRYDFPRGVPTAIQMLVRYLIIGAGLLLALSVLGIRMSDLSLLAGALGVGIGFGLRNIMANFISGILMIFERPVQLGDVVEVDKIFGDVQRIGVRATTIKTYDGSEVMVPNADFITKEVTNWTLSSKLRRVKMAYKVAFGNNPREVIRIIERVIATHPDIKGDPAPKVLFEGYGDYYLEFTVYFWVEERLLDVKSETAIAIYEALSEAGIKMPVPFSNIRYEGTSPAESGKG